jgi:hypothetical protein
MARRIIAGGCAALALAFMLYAPATEAQSSRNWGRAGAPGGPFASPPPLPPAQSAPPARGAPRLPEYYLERRGPVAAPSAPMPPGGDVSNSLRARGFRDIAPPQQRGNTTIIPQATGPSGERVQLIIGPRGEIVGARVLGPDGIAPVPGRR